MKAFSTRQRIFVSSFVIGVLFFVLVSPIVTMTFDFFAPPSRVSNIIVTKTAIGSVLMEWDLNYETDIKEYLVTKNNENLYLKNNVDNYLFTDIDSSSDNQFGISVIDTSGKVSETTQFTFEDLLNISNFNESNNANNFIIKLAIKILLLLTTTILFTAWSLFFKISRKKIIKILLLPSLIILPYLFLAVSTIESVNQIPNKLIVSFVISILTLVVSYISLLTTNILNAATITKLPLEQAGKATHFILSLTSTYLILIYSFGSYQNVIFRFLLLLPFVYLYTYISLVLNSNNVKQAVIKSTGISSIVLLALIVSSTWPIEVAYAILLIAVIYYILLNLALEIRTKYTRALWVEYILLLGLILILFLSTSNWGINFSIL